MFNSPSRIATALERLADLYAQDLASRGLTIVGPAEKLVRAVQNLNVARLKPRVYHMEEEPEPVWPVQSPSQHPK